MFSSLRNAFKVPDLRKKILFTIAMLAIYRFGANIPVPGVDVQRIQNLFQRGGLLQLLDLFSGGALSQFAVFALGIMPYITVTIIMQLLTVVIPKLEEWVKEGEAGQRKITQITRYFTLVLAITQSIGLIFFFQGQGVIPRFSFFNRFLIVASLSAGTVLIMWLGELITQHGIGNGMSLLIFTSIIARFPISLVKSFQVASSYIILIAIVVSIIIVGAIVLMEKGQRRIPVQYAKRIVGRKVYGGQSTYIPLKVIQAGVIPIIFASSVLLFPGTMAQFFKGRFFQVMANALSPTAPLFLILYAGLIIFFTYFYTAITFNPIDVSDNMKKYGGFIPGVRPGQPTALYINRIMSRITLPGAMFLALIAVIPTILMGAMNVPFLAQFGGTSILIIVGVVLETLEQLEAQLLMRHYKGFLK